MRIFHATFRHSRESTIPPSWEMKRQQEKQKYRNVSTSLQKSIEFLSKHTRTHMIYNIRMLDLISQNRGEYSHT